jgi:hypothetical protein
MKKCFLVLFLLVVPNLSAAQYFQDFSAASIGATNFGDESEVVSEAGAAGVQDEALKELRLTPNEPNTRAAFLASPLDAGNKTLAFSAKWNGSTIFDSPNAGDGFQFTFGKIQGSNVLESWSNPIGLTFRVQTTPGNSAYMILVNGQTITNKPFVPEASSLKRKYFEVDWRYTNGLTVKLDGIPLLGAPTSAFTPSFQDRFAWISKNSESASQIALDNIAIVTGGTLAIVPGSGFFSSERNPNFGPMKADDDDNTSEFAVFAHSGFDGGNFPPARPLLFYALTSGIDSPDPHNWTLEGGPNSSGPWTTIATGDWNFLTRQETRIWPVTNSVAFPSYRFSFPTNNSATLATYVGDIRLLEFKPYSPPHVSDISQSQSSPTQFQLTFTGAATNSIAQFTVDFTTWTDFATNVLSEPNAWTVTDPDATNQVRFYRLKQ